MNITTLVISAPWNKKDEAGYNVGKPGKRYSFEYILKTGIGEGYAIGKKYISRLIPGSKVILLRNDKDKKRAEGILVKPPVPTGIYLPQGIQRYNVHFKDAKVVSYRYMPKEKLNRQGVTVILSGC